MILRDFGKLGQVKLDQWLQQILAFSQKKISFEDNMDSIFQVAYIASGGTQVQHSLGRIPLGVIEVATQQTGTKGISPQVGKEWTNKFIYLNRDTSGDCTLIIY